MRLLRAHRDGRPARGPVEPERSSPSSGRIAGTTLVRDERGGGPAHVLPAGRPTAAGDPRQGGGAGGRQPRVPVGGQPGAVHAVLPARALPSPRPPSPAAPPSPRLLPAGSAHDATDFRTGFARQTADAATAVSRTP